MIRRRDLITLMGGATAWPLAARAQQRDRMRRLGVLMGSPNDSVGHANATALVQGLSALGWQEGSNLRIACRPHHEGARGTGGLAVDVDARLWTS